MTPAELKANLDRFNQAGRRAERALQGIKRFQQTQDIPEALAALLIEYGEATTIMLDSSAELIGVTGPLSLQQA